MAVDGGEISLLRDLEKKLRTIDMLLVVVVARSREVVAARTVSVAGQLGPSRRLW